MYFGVERLGRFKSGEDLRPDEDGQTEVREETRGQREQL